MATYALIANDHIVNVVEWDGKSDYEPAGIDQITAVDELPAGAWIGWSRDAKGDWSPPPPLLVD